MVWSELVSQTSLLNKLDVLEELASLSYIPKKSYIRDYKTGKKITGMDFSGFIASEILWPGPTRIPVEPLMTYGYEDEALLLTKITSPKNISYPVNIGAKVSWFTCKDICLPQEGEVSIKLLQGSKFKNEFTSVLKEIEKTTYKQNDKCYKFDYETVTCDTKKSIIDFTDSPDDINESTPGLF